MVINFRPRTRYYAAQVALGAIVDFDSYRSANACVKEAIIRPGIYDRFESFAGRVIVDDLNRQYGAPDSRLVWHASIAYGKGFVAYAQRCKTLGSQ